jgi:hypothetical protein
MRESYRLNRFLLGEGGKLPPKSFELIFMYTGRTVGLRGGTSFTDVNMSMQKIMKALARERG